jgi:hypothetical protein
MQFIVITIAINNTRKMKYSTIFLIVLIAFCACRSAKPATGKPAATNEPKEIAINPQSTRSVPDTLNYVKSIIANKDKYINKELSILLNDLKIPVKSYSPGISANNRYVSPNITFSFDDMQTTNSKQDQTHGLSNPVYLTIAWKTPLSKEETSAALSKSTNAGNWGPVEEGYYSKQIVGDIK